MRMINHDWVIEAYINHDLIKELRTKKIAYSDFRDRISIEDYFETVALQTSLSLQVNWEIKNQI